jgi:hypothetical protein
MRMSGIRYVALHWLLPLCLLVPGPGGIHAAELPWKAAEIADLEGIWRQVGVVVLDPRSDPQDPWFQAKQFFRFPRDGGFKHVLVNPDSEPERTAPNAMQRLMLEEAPVVQKLSWHKRGVGLLKHPEHPQQRVDFGIYLHDAPKGLNNGAVEPRKGDLILIFYSHTNINLPVYYRLLRKQP